MRDASGFTLLKALGAAKLSLIDALSPPAPPPPASHLRRGDLADPVASSAASGELLLAIKTRGGNAMAWLVFYNNFCTDENRKNIVCLLLNLTYKFISCFAFKTVAVLLRNIITALQASGDSLAN